MCFVREGMKLNDRMPDCSSCLSTLWFPMHTTGGAVGGGLERTHHSFDHYLHVDRLTLHPTTSLSTE